ncbi:MAG: pentapeptide repeat-containing protein, partial [Burkholderiales bacterium]
MKKLIVGLCLLALPALAADLNPEQVRAALEKATAQQPADFTGKDLSNLDLSQLDFKGANLSKA